MLNFVESDRILFSPCHVETLEATVQFFISFGIPVCFMYFHTVVGSFDCVHSVTLNKYIVAG